MSKQAVIITSSQPILADGVKTILAKNLVNASNISVNIDRDAQHTVVQTQWGNLVMLDDPQLMTRVFSDNVLQPKAVVLATSGTEVIHAAMAKLMNGEYFIDPSFEREQQATDLTLTDRQAEILQMYADGATTQDIAAALGLSTETIRTHTKRILAKLNARTRTHAVAIGGSRSIIHPPKA